MLGDGKVLSRPDGSPVQVSRNPLFKRTNLSSNLTDHFSKLCGVLIYTTHTIARVCRYLVRARHTWRDSVHNMEESRSSRLTHYSCRPTNLVNSDRVVFQLCRTLAGTTLARVEKCCAQTFQEMSNAHTILLTSGSDNCIVQICRPCAHAFKCIWLLFKSVCVLFNLVEQRSRLKRPCLTHG